MQVENSSQDLLITQPVKKYTFTAKQLLISIFTIILIFAGLLIWKMVGDNQLRKEFAFREASLETQAKQQQLESSKRQLKLIIKPYTWAIRAALLKGDVSQINDYANDIVKEKNVVLVMVVDPKNTVISSTNKKFEGKDYVSFGPAYYLGVDSAIVNKVNDSLLTVVSPIMSFNSKLGTIIFNYAIRPPVFSMPN